MPLTRAVAIADDGKNFLDIAGNKKILLTVIVSQAWSYQERGEVFTE